MKTIQSVLLGGVMAFALAACNTTDTAGTSSTGSSSMGTTAAGSTGNPTVDAQMGVTPEATTGAPTASGSASTPTNTGHTTTNSETRK
jgi:predicted small secreted protein